MKRIHGEMEDRRKEEGAERERGAQQADGYMSLGHHGSSVSLLYLLFLCKQYQLNQGQAAELLSCYLSPYSLSMLSPQD